MLQAIGPYDIGHSSTPAPLSSSSSSSSSSAFHMDDLTHHTHSLIQKATGQTKVEAVVGCSIGGVLALRYAMLYPSHIKNIISIAAPGIKTPERARRLWEERTRLFEEDVRSGREGLCYATVERWFPGGSERDVRAREVCLGFVRGCSLDGYRIFAGAISDYDFDGDVQRMMPRGVRCLIIAGNMDEAIDVEGLRRSAKRIERAEFKLMEVGGHLPPLQIREEFEGVMMEFLERGKGDEF